MPTTITIIIIEDSQLLQGINARTSIQFRHIAGTEAQNFEASKVLKQVFRFEPIVLKIAFWDIVQVQIDLQIGDIWCYFCERFDA